MDVLFDSNLLDHILIKKSDDTHNSISVVFSIFWVAFIIMIITFLLFQGVVSGVLLVTPNAIMFDPNVSDPLVLEHGADMYGMMAPMETVISAAMYHDIAAMKIKSAPKWVTFFFFFFPLSQLWSLFNTYYLIVVGQNKDNMLHMLKGKCTDGAFSHLWSGLHTCGLS